MEIKLRLWRILLLGVVADFALRQSLLQLSNLILDEVGVLSEIQDRLLCELLKPAIEEATRKLNGHFELRPSVLEPAIFSCW